MQARRFALRSFLVLVSVSAPLALVVGLFVSQRPSARVTVESSAFHKIQPGMTEEQVISILGMPPGDYSTDPTLAFLYLGPGQVTAGEDWGTPKEWRFNSWEVAVWFKDGKAHRVGFGQGMCRPNWLERTFHIRMGPPSEPDD